MFEVQSERGTKKYNLLSKVVKSFLALRNGNANVERSLSDNKNTLSSEWTKVSVETLGGLRGVEEHATSCSGAYNTNTLAKGILWVIVIVFYV